MSYCKKCGTELTDDQKFCMACGTPCGVENKESKWDGGVLDIFITCLVAGLICLFTIGLGFPWALVYIIKFLVRHLVIDGERYIFDGTGGQFLATWIKWFILIVITCGIYSFWVLPQMYNWIASHIHKAEEK